MITNCHSYSGNCPCLNCDKECCFQSRSEIGKTDTEKLCATAKEYCEKCVLEELAGNICDNFCKYRDTCDENAECDYIRQGNDCPLDILV